MRSGGERIENRLDGSSVLSADAVSFVESETREARSYWWSRSVMLEKEGGEGGRTDLTFGFDAGNGEGSRDAQTLSRDCISTLTSGNEE
jgi:hypothetical protein